MPSHDVSQSASVDSIVSEPMSASHVSRKERHRFHTRRKSSAKPSLTRMTSTIEFTQSYARIEVDNLDTPCSLNMTACRQCLNALMSRPPKAFRAQINYNSHPGVVKVKIDILYSLLNKIPLLADICESTAATASKKTAFHAPCPAWGLLSLLILMERSVKMQQWLGGADSAPSLAGMTLQVRYTPGPAGDPCCSASAHSCRLACQFHR